MNYDYLECESEDEARSKSRELISKNIWPCYFFESDTTGEKGFEEFYTDKETLDLDIFHSIGVIKNSVSYNNDLLDFFEKEITALKQNKQWNKKDLLNIFLNKNLIG